MERLGRHLALAVLAGALATMAAVIAVRPWGGFLREPWAEGDGVLYAAMAVTMVRHGWVSWNPDLGYPFGMDLAGFPMPEFRSWGLLWVMTRVTEDPFVAVNLLFLSGFALVGAASYLLFAAAVRSTWLSLLLAVAAALLPWHFTRANHLLLADYSPVPLALLIGCLMWRGWWDDRPRRLIPVALVAVHIGMGGAYYVAFALLGWAPVVIWRLWRHRRLQRLVADLMPAALASATLLASVALWMAQGRQPSVDASFARLPEQSLVFAGDLPTLLKPWPFWPTSIEEGAANYHLIAGLAVLLTVVLLVLLGVRREAVRPGLLPLRAEVGPWLLLFGWFVVWYIAGLGYLLALILTPEIRSWGRLSLQIAFVSLVVLGICARRLVDARPMWLPAVAAALVLVLGGQLALDHRPLLAPAARVTAGEARTYAELARAALEQPCPVLQLPVMDHPEDWTLAPRYGMEAYDHLWLAIMAPELPLSFGTVRGTDAAVLARQRSSKESPLEQLVANARADGFCAVHLDRLGMDGDAADAITRALGRPITQTDRWSLFRLTGTSAQG
jgi:hypothetical protein